MTEKERMYAEKLYDPYKVPDNPWATIRAACKKFNESDFWRDCSALNELKQHFAKASDDMVLTPPFYCDHGDRIYFGKHFYANTGLTILDENTVTFGDDVFLAPHVSIYTAGHPISAEVRNLDLEYAKPVKIGNSVWIGGNVIINPGVTIGDDVVIGSGSVVTNDIPSHVVAAGNPCRVIRQITEDDNRVCKEQLKDYMNDKDIRG
ncbi:MAG: sugar O-acetyltransferase [Lachnospiraceae bacterium]|nr:sugar O-acetyltransferase [Lachnospiraceae bacterium]